MPSRARVDVGPFPAGAVAAVVEYRVENPRGEWHRLGQAGAPVSSWIVAGERPVRLRARPVAKGGRPMGPWRQSDVWWPTEALSDREDPSDLTLPSTRVEVDGPVIKVQQPLETREPIDEYEVEVRTGPASGDPADAWQVGLFPASQVVAAPLQPDVTTQDVHVRIVRNEDGRLGDWQTTTVQVPNPPYPHTEDHGNGFASGTINDTADGNTIAPLEISGGDLRHAAVYAGDVDAYAGDLGLYAGDMQLYWSPAVYLTQDVILPEPEDIQIQLWPELTATTRQTFYAGDWQFPIVSPRYQEDGSRFDGRLLDHSIQNGDDETPLVVEAKVATSASASPSFTYPTDYEDWWPGRVFTAVKSYSVAFIVKTFLSKRIVFDRLVVRRWLYCRSRPWHSHSLGWELLAEDVAVSDTNQLAVSGLPSAGYDELRLEITWYNNDATTTGLLLRFNSDSGSNYYDSAGNQTSCILPASIAQGDSQRVEAWIRSVDSVARGITAIAGAWNGSGTVDPVEKTYHWTNTANEITALSVDAASGNNAILSGTVLRVWGRRHNKAST